jgi:hypothetical protein
VHIELDDLSRPEIAELLREHLTSMHDHSLPESVHGLPIEGLRSPEITFWSVWENSELLGCGAVRVWAGRALFKERERGGGAAISEAERHLPRLPRTTHR